MKFEIFNTFVNISSEEEYIKNIFETLQNNKKKTFFYLNSYSFYLFNKNKMFRDALSNADYIIPDGYSIVWANKMLNQKKISKVVFTYSFTKKLAKLFEEHNMKVFFLGGTDLTLKKCIYNLSITNPNLNIVGFNNGFYTENDSFNSIIKRINESHTDILIIGMGMPKSEIWIDQNHSKLNCNCIFSVGGFFEFIAGNKIQAPKWMYNSGIEWVFRLIQEPKRLFFRYLVSNSFFIYKILKRKIELYFE